MEVAIDRERSSTKSTVPHEKKRAQIMTATDTGARWHPAGRSLDSKLGQTVSPSQSPVGSYRGATCSDLDSLLTTPRYMHWTSTWQGKVSEKSLSRSSSTSTPIWSLAGVDKNPKPLRPSTTARHGAPISQSEKNQKTAAKERETGLSVSSGTKQTPHSEGKGRSQALQARSGETDPHGSPGEEAKNCGGCAKTDDRHFYQARCFPLSMFPRFGRCPQQQNGKQVDKTAARKTCAGSQRGGDDAQCGWAGNKDAQRLKNVSPVQRDRCDAADETTDCCRRAYTPDPWKSKRILGEGDYTPRFMRCTEAWEGKVQDKKRPQTTGNNWGLPPRVNNARKTEPSQMQRQASAPLTISRDRQMRSEGHTSMRTHSQRGRTASQPEGCVDESSKSDRGRETSENLGPFHLPNTFEESGATGEAKAQTPGSVAKEAVGRDVQECTAPSAQKPKNTRPAGMIQKLAKRIGLRKENESNGTLHTQLIVG